MTACRSDTSNSTQQGKKSIVTTSFIGYDLAHHIAGDKGHVINVLPWGSELHNFEPRAKDKVAIEEADLFLYLGDDFEPWVKESGKQKNALNLSESYEITEHHHETESHEVETDSHEGEDSHVHGTHFWTDPIVFCQLIEETRDALIKMDPKNKGYYEKQAQSYYNEIMNIHEEFDGFMQSNPQKTIFFSGHNAVGPFAERYHLTIAALSNETRPDADITPQQLGDLKEAIIKNKAHYLFTEELVTPKVANQIKTSLENENYDLTLLELNGYHNISKEQHKKGVTYGELFKKNTENIKRALAP